MKAHPVVHFEIGCQEGEKTRKFFAQLFGWEISDHSPGMTINTGSAKGIGGHINDLAPEWGAYVTVYIEVDELEGYLKKAGELGGKTLVPPVTVPGQGDFAWLAAPEGNIIGIWKPATDSNNE
ncbi:MAG: VOC family protein [Rhodothermales bacterium]